MKDGKQQKKIVAEIYDRLSSEFYDYHAKRGDVDFYVGLAKESGGPVLELGCGTGRLLIPTARAGIPITGLDNPAEMLAVCKSKLKHESSDVQARASLVHADMRDFFRYKVEHLLARAGLRIELIYAGFDKETFGSTYPSELIVVARKAEQGPEIKHER